MNTHLDHLVIAAASLEQGVAWCEATLGVTPGPGGRHALMGTHNRLSRIATDAFPDAYLEIIAIDPQAAPAGRVRWFGLDDPARQAQLRESGPRLIHAVARTAQLDMQRWALITLGLKPGNPVRAGRDTPQGPLAWQILLREDGELECGGALPTLIQWEGRHPAHSMPESGLALRSLTLHGVPERARELLKLRGVDVYAGPGPALQAVLSTPLGDVTLDSGALAPPRNPDT
jgi:hypothetical protein